MKMDSDNNDSSIEKYRSPVKRRREQHVIITSSQDDEGFRCDDNQSDDNSMMDCDNDSTGPNKRRRLGDTFPFDNNGQIIQIQLKQEEIDPYTNGSLVIEECAGKNISSGNKGISPVEWWRKKRPLANITSPVDAAIHSKSLVKQEDSSSCSAMDTSVGDNEVCCHICQKNFLLPVIPSVRDVMPANSLLNYFSPLNKRGTSDGDVAMEMVSSHITRRSSSHQNFINSPAWCSCCDRPSCPECRRKCEVCQKSFCSFCSIASDGAKSNSCFCLDCCDRLGDCRH